MIAFSPNSWLTSSNTAPTFFFRHNCTVLALSTIHSHHQSSSGQDPLRYCHIADLETIINLLIYCISKSTIFDPCSLLRRLSTFLQEQILVIFLKGFVA